MEGERVLKRRTTRVGGGRLRGAPCRRALQRPGRSLSGARRGGRPACDCHAGPRGVTMVVFASRPDVEETGPSGAAEEVSSIIENLKSAAMNLHTKDQSASGGQKAKKRPEFVPTLEGYLRYLVDSRVIFSTMEDIVKENAELSLLLENGLERTNALERDIAYLESLEVQPVAVEGEASPGSDYSTYLKTLSQENLPGFICHYFNTYFAHTAGGRMIGKAVSDRILDGRKLDFYHDYPEPVSKLSKRVKDSLEDIAREWSEEEKEKCVGETGKAFQYAGQVMRQITMSSSSE